MIIGYTLIATVLVVIGIDVSKVFLARRALGSAADAAALTAAQGVDAHAIYLGAGLRCGQRLPLAPARATALAADSIAAERSDLRRVFADVADPRTAVADGTVTVEVSGEVAVPFGRVLAWLDPSRPTGRVHVTVSSHAVSPVAGEAGCS